MRLAEVAENHVNHLADSENQDVRAFVLVAAAVLAVLSTSCAVQSLATIQEQMGPQVFSEPDIPIAGGEDAGVLRAVEAAVSVSSELGFRHDASGSKKGREDVEARWKGQPVTLKMRFQRREASAQYQEGIYLSSRLTQPGDVYLEGGGQKIERLFYSRLVEVTTQRGVRIYGDPAPNLELMD